MKTIEAFIKEIEGSEALKDELKATKDKDALAAFLKKYEVSGTVEDFAKALKAMAEAEGEISDEAAEGVAGGKKKLPITADEFLFDKLVRVFGTDESELM